VAFQHFSPGALVVLRFDGTGKLIDSQHRDPASFFLSFFKGDLSDSIRTGASEGGSFVACRVCLRFWLGVCVV